MGLDTWGHQKLGNFDALRRVKGRGTFRFFCLEGCLANSCSPICSAKVRLESASPNWVQLIIVMGPMDYETLNPGFRAARLCQGLQVYLSLASVQAGSNILWKWVQKVKVTLHPGASIQVCQALSGDTGLPGAEICSSGVRFLL